MSTRESEEFINSILQLIHNEDLREKMGIEGRNYALTQKWDRIFDQLLWHYYHVIQEPKEQKFA